MDKNSSNNRFRENSLNENLNDRGHNSTEDTVDSVQNLSTNSKHKWLKTTNVIVMECYYLSKPVKMKKENQYVATEDVCMEFGRKEDCLMLQNKGCVIKLE